MAPMLPLARASRYSGALYVQPVHGWRIARAARPADHALNCPATRLH